MPAGDMETRDGQSGLHRLGSLTVGVALVPAMVGFATEYWLLGDSEIRHVGLWKVCGDKNCETLHSETIPEWFSAVRGLSVMALCLHLISVVTGLCCACLETHEANVFSFVRRLQEVAAVLAGGLIAAALAVFAHSSHEHPVFRNFSFDWSFWLNMADLFLLLTGGALVFVSRGDCARRQRRGRGYRKQVPTADDSLKTTPIYRDPNGAGKGFLQNNLLPVDKAKTTTTVPMKNNFIEKLKSSTRVQSFSSLEGIPRVLEKLTGTSNAKDMSGSLVDV